MSSAVSEKPTKVVFAIELARVGVGQFLICSRIANVGTRAVPTFSIVVVLIPALALKLGTAASATKRDGDSPTPVGAVCQLQTHRLARGSEF